MFNSGLSVFIKELLLLNFIAICYLCIYLTVLPNFNHCMHACTWFATDEPFSKRRCYVMLCYVIKGGQEDRIVYPTLV